MQLQAGKKSHGSLVSGRCRWFPILVDRSRRPVSREPLSWSAALLRAAPQPGPAKLPRCPGRKADYWYRFAELSRRSESWAPSDRIPNLPYLVPSCSLHRSEMLFGWERYFRRVPAVHAVAPLIRALESAPGWDPAKPQLPPVFRWQARGRGSRSAASRLREEHTPMLPDRDRLLLEPWNRGPGDEPEWMAAMKNSN